MAIYICLYLDIKSLYISHISPPRLFRPKWTLLASLIHPIPLFSRHLPIGNVCIASNLIPSLGTPTIFLSYLAILIPFHSPVHERTALATGACACKHSRLNTQAKDPMHAQTSNIACNLTKLRSNWYMPHVGKWARLNIVFGALTPYKNHPVSPQYPLLFKRRENTQANCR